MRRVDWGLAGLLGLVALGAPPALGQPADRDPLAILEVGGAAEQGLKGQGFALGPALAVETTPVENWLELEAGVSPLFHGRHTEWDTDLLFKKPYTLSDRVELMVGAGPEWDHANALRKGADSLGGEAALDLMFWPSGHHRFGWYLEPSYGYSFGPGHEQGLNLSAGLLVALP